MFITYFMMTTHVIACLWILTAKMDTNVEDSWIYSLDFENKTEIYMTSFYFTVTTITTVGYGDMSASTTLEQVVCVLFMIIGVIAFSMASGALTNYISSEDQKNAAYEDKMKVLEELQDKY
jgi:Trk-type K+ transport system membrane component